MKKKYNIRGMHCRSCEILLEKSISRIRGVKKVEVSQKRGIAEVEFANEAVNDDLIAKAVNDTGYSLGEARKLSWLSRDGKEWFEILLGVSAVFLLWMILSVTGILSVFNVKFSAAPTYPIIFVIGLTAGISTCMALVGGLVAGFSATYAETHQYATRWQRFRPNLFFNTGRLISYAVFGGLIGALGSVVKLSSGFTGFLIVMAGVLMVYIGLKLTGISPKLSNMNFTLPKKLGRAIGLKNQNCEYSHKEAFVAGALTFFLPCGFTQAMQLYTITTGSFASGVVIMSFFALGTMPGLLGIGALTSILQGKAARIFFRFVGVVVLVLGLLNLANGLNAGGWKLSLPPSFSGSGNSVPVSPVTIENGEQIVNMDQLTNGYRPNSFTIKKGIPVKWIIDSQNAYTCAASIRLSAYGIAQFLQEGQNIIRFTPTQAGSVRFTCGMGMYSGTFTVVE